MSEQIQTNEKGTNGLGIASLVIGIIAILTMCCYGGVLGIIGLILGIVGVSLKNVEKGTATAGIVLNTISIVFLVLILFSFISPALLSSYINTSSSDTYKFSDEINTIEIAIDETKTIDDMEVTLVSCVEVESTSSWSSSAEGYKFIEITLDFKNISDETKTINTYGFSCYADDYLMDSAYLTHEYNFDSSIAPGKKTIGEVSYSVPIDCESITLEYEMNKNNKIIFIIK